MKRILSILSLLLVLALWGASSRADDYDVSRDYACNPGAGWSFDAYRAEDGKYLPLLYGRAAIREVSRYGCDAFYLPDGDQTNYPFFAKFDKLVICSPATKGKRYDAVVTWTAPKGVGTVSVRGKLTLMGDIRGRAGGKKVGAKLMLNDKAIWSGKIIGGEPAVFSVNAAPAEGDVLRLHIMNDGDEAGNVTAVELRIGG